MHGLTYFDPILYLHTRSRTQSSWALQSKISHKHKFFANFLKLSEFHTFAASQLQQSQIALQVRNRKKHRGSGFFQISATRGYGPAPAQFWHVYRWMLLGEITPRVSVVGLGSENDHMYICESEHNQTHITGGNHNPPTTDWMKLK